MPSAANAGARRFHRVDGIPPLRPSPFEADDRDPERATYAKALWHDQDELLRQRDRQVEENIRMLLGQQWIVWSELRGMYVDLAEHLDDDERRWRHMPVLNRIFLWYVLTHARMTENPPVISWLPGPDRLDAELASVMDPVFKHIWRNVGMIEVIDRLASWLIPSGRAHLKSRIDPMLGDPIQAIDKATLRLLNEHGNPILGPDGHPIERELDNVPLDEFGEPKARLIERDGMLDVDGLEEEPAIFHEGGIDVDVLTCLEVRGEWGAHIPWHKKAYHVQRSFLTPIQAYEAFGVELEPDIRGSQAEDVASIWRVLHGEGLWGAAEARRGSGLQSTADQAFVSIYEVWQRPGRFPGTQRGMQGEPGGRLLIATGGGEVLRDGQRTADFNYTSPIRSFDFANLPGRPQGTSPQEMLNGPVRSRNRLHGQGIQHATLMANPITVIDRGSGIQEGDVGNVPGEQIHADLRDDNVKPVQYIEAPRLGDEVYETADRLSSEIDQLGSIAGSQGDPPTTDPSGELVKELRFNSDRPLAAPMRRMVIELARLAEDWKVLVPLVWDVEKTIQVAGEDNIARTLTVYPELFKKGTVQASPEIESMLPEGRGERQSRMFRFWQEGVWGPKDSPEAINTFLDLARFPHMSQAVRPGGPDRATAERNMGLLLQGTPAEKIPVFEWYDHAIHLHVLERFMKGPEYLKSPVPVMQEAVAFRQKLQEAQAAAVLNQQGRELAVQAEAAARQAMAGESVAGEIGGAEPPNTPAEGQPASVEERGGEPMPQGAPEGSPTPEAVA